MPRAIWVKNIVVMLTGSGSVCEMKRESTTVVGNPLSCHFLSVSRTLE